MTIVSCANYFRLYLHCLAANLLVGQRQVVADPPAVNPPSPLPTEALAGRARKQFFSQRRQADPLGEGHAETWRTRLIKVAAEVVVRARRIIIRLSASWPFLEQFRAVCQANARLAARGWAQAKAATQPGLRDPRDGSPLGERGGCRKPDRHVAIKWNCAQPVRGLSAFSCLLLAQP